MAPVKALDQDRKLLANWVHVGAEANRKIEALAPVILRQATAAPAAAAG